MATMVELWLSLNGTSQLALSIPLNKCRDLSVNPLKWLRFLGYSIYGQEGYLSLSATGPPIKNDTGNILAQPYYFISQGQPHLADVDAIDDRTSDGTAFGYHRADFRNRITSNLVLRRTGCIGAALATVYIGEVAEFATACHIDIIPHAKGDDMTDTIKYIANALREPDVSESEPFDSIDDTRNGLLLAGFLHQPFGNGSLAFLKTPTLYLSVDDIPYNPPPQTNSTSRITLHYIVDSIGLVGGLISNNSDLREPPDTREWPPAKLINMFYTAAALQAWAPAPFKQAIREMSRDTYYSTSFDSPGDELGDNGPRNPPTQDINRQLRPNARNKAKAVGRPHHSEQTELGFMMDGVMSLWKRSARQGLKRTTASDLNSRVETWLNDPPHPGVFNPDDGVVTEGE